MRRAYTTYLDNDQVLKFAPAAGAITPHAEVTGRYQFIPTIKVVDMLRSAGWFPVDATQSSVRQEEREGFQKHMIRFQRSDTVISTTGERVDLVLYNSHDRSSAYQLIASVYRQVCGNGLLVGNNLHTFSMRHMFCGEADIIEASYRIVDSATEISDQVAAMKAIELKPDEKGAYAMAAMELVYDDPNAAPIRPEQLLCERRFDDKGDNLWNTFNVVQENLMRGGLRGRNKSGKRMKTRPVTALDRNVKLNKALWTLTEKMRELKS